MAKEYDSGGIFSSGNNPFANGYGSSILSDMILGFGDFAFGDSDVFSNFFKEISGYSSQQREFEQQEYFQDKENEYNTPAAQMARYKEAGINPQLAAQGIAGVGSTSASPANVNGNESGPANGLSSVGKFANDITDMGVKLSQRKLNNANANKADVEANAVPQELDIRRKIALSQLMNSLQGSSLENIEAAGIAFDVASGGIPKMVDYLRSYNGVREAETRIGQMKNELDKQEKYLNEYYDRQMEAEISLAEKQALAAEKQAKLSEAQTTYQNMKNDVYKTIPGCDLSEATQLRYLAEKYGVDSPQFKALAESLYQYQYNLSLGGFDADIDTAFSRYYNQSKAKADVDASFAPYMKKIEVIGDALKEFTRAMMENPSSIDGAITTFMNKIFVALYGTQINMDPVNGATKPAAGNADSSHHGK